MHFIYDIPTKVYFGKDLLQNNLSKEIKKYSDKVLLVYGKSSIKKMGLYDKVIEELKKGKIEVFELSGIDPNPRVTDVNKGVQICRENDIKAVLAVGGGSSIDCAKFIGAGYYYDSDAWDLIIYPEKVTNSLPIFSVLTLAATGSEMDPNAVISNITTNEKIGGTHRCLYPKVSFLDPTNTFTVSEYQTACGSADIISHLIEQYFSPYEDLELLDNIIEGLLKTVIKYTPIALENPKDYTARANLMWTSSLALNGLVEGSKIQAWSCHPLEHQLSAFYDITHGLGLAILTPRWMRFCIKNPENISRFKRFAINVFDISENQSDIEIAEKGIQKLEEFFFETCKLNKTLSEIGIDDRDFEEMAERITGGKVFDTCYEKMTKNDIISIYKACL
ncbi:MAG: iron-containing alcohol dehydrogenase [Clostridia bacterium]|nr:iron-containing alcohol dehydrogenase [Clostridia bacterium]